MEPLRYNRDPTLSSTIYIEESRRTLIHLCWKWKLKAVSCSVSVSKETINTVKVRNLGTVLPSFRLLLNMRQRIFAAPASIAKRQIGAIVSLISRKVVNTLHNSVFQLYKYALDTRDKISALTIALYYIQSLNTFCNTSISSIMLNDIIIYDWSITKPYRWHSLL